MEKSGADNRENRLGPADYVVACLFGAVILVIGAQVVFRYVFNSSLTWSEEVARFLFTWLIFLGAALAVRDAANIRIELLVARLPAACLKWVTVGTYVLLICFFLWGAYWGVHLVLETAGTQSPALALSEGFFRNAALPISFALAACYGLLHLIRELRRAARSGGSSNDQQGGA